MEFVLLIFGLIVIVVFFGWLFNIDFWTTYYSNKFIDKVIDEELSDEQGIFIEDD